MIGNDIQHGEYGQIRSDQKTYIVKVDRNNKKPRGRHGPHWPFWGPLAAILDFAGGAALQAVGERPLRR